MSKGNHKTVVLGLGRCGGKVVEKLSQNSSFSGLRIAAVDSDRAFLDSLTGVNKISAGSKRTDGLGCGEDPEVGVKAILDNIGDVKDFIGDSGCVIVVGGLGKGFCTGAVPVLADVFKELDVVPIFALTSPFSVEGGVARIKANAVFEKLGESANNVIHISNGLFYSSLDADTPLDEIFTLSDRSIAQAVCSLIDILKYEPEDIITLEFSAIAQQIGQRQTDCAFSVASNESKNFSEVIDQLIEFPLSGGEEYIKSADIVIVKVTCSSFTAAETTQFIEMLGERLGCTEKLRVGFHLSSSCSGVSVSSLIIKYSDPLLKGRKRSSSGRNQMELGLVEHNLGVFAEFQGQGKVLDEEGNSLDIPTFQRLGIAIEDL